MKRRVPSGAWLLIAAVVVSIAAALLQTWVIG